MMRFEREGIELDRFMHHLELVHRVAELADHPTAAAVAAIRQAGEVADGPEHAAEFLEDCLDDAASPAVRRALHLQLADHYRHLRRPDRALDHLRAVIVSDED